jgi:hypothetical protein
VISAFGWQVRPEVSFAQCAERGSIDLLAWHETMRTVLVVEVKTELTSIEETVRRLDIKVRVASTVAQQLLGWEPLNVGTVLVLPDVSTARRRVAAHPATFDARFPQMGQRLRSWLRSPVGAFAAVWFLSGVPTVGSKWAGPTAHRVRRPQGPSRVAARR